MLKLHNLYKVYRTDEVETVALNGVNVEIAQGDFVAIMGPSGCGKSTLLNIVGMLDNPSEGDLPLFHIYIRELWLCLRSNPPSSSLPTGRCFGGAA